MRVETYVHGEMGIRHEDITFIIEDGAENMTPFAADEPQTAPLDPKDLITFQDSVDLLLLTATPTELNAIKALLKPPPGKFRVLKTQIGPLTYYLGTFGSCLAVVTRSQMGSASRGGSITTTTRAIESWFPRAVIMVGLAFGRDQTKQRIADVLVASQVACYELQRVGSDRVIQRGPIHAVGITLLDRFSNTPDWRFALPDGSHSAVHVGQVLTGDKLVDNFEFRDQLFQGYPSAIGGEMEGAGLVVAGSSVEWILVKAICDWADGQKHSEHQLLAATAAADLVHHVLKPSGVLSHLPKAPLHAPPRSPHELEQRYAKGERDFRGAQLRNTRLKATKLQGVDLRGADLEHARFPKGADLRGSDLRGANLRHARLSLVELHGVRLDGADLGEARLEEANLSGANLCGSDLRRAHLNGATLRGACLWGANLAGADFRESRGSRDSARVDTYEDEFQDLGPVPTQLSGAEFDGAKVHGAHFEGVNLVWARGLTPPQLESACVDDRTRGTKPHLEDA